MNELDPSLAWGDIAQAYINEPISAVTEAEALLHTAVNIDSNKKMEFDEIKFRTSMKIKPAVSVAAVSFLFHNLTDTVTSVPNSNNPEDKYRYIYSYDDQGRVLHRLMLRSAFQTHDAITPPEIIEFDTVE